MLFLIHLICVSQFVLLCRLCNEYWLGSFACWDLIACASLSVSEPASAKGKQRPPPADAAVALPKTASVMCESVITTTTTTTTTINNTTTTTTTTTTTS